MYVCVCACVCNRACTCTSLCEYNVDGEICVWVACAGMIAFEEMSVSFCKFVLEFEDICVRMKRCVVIK